MQRPPVMKGVFKISIKRKIPQYNKADWTALREAARNLSTSITETASAATSPNTEILWTKFKDRLNDLIAQHIPHTTTRPKPDKPWVSYSLRRLIRKRNRLYKNWRKSGNEAHKEEMQKVKRQVQRQLRRAYWAHTENLFTEGNPTESKKRFWAYRKAKSTQRSNIAPLKVDGRLIHEAKEKAETLNTQFKKAFSQSEPVTPEDFTTISGLSTNTKPDNQTCRHIHINESGVNKLLKTLDPSKAPGPDGLCPKLLNQLADEITPALTAIFQSSIDTGIVPLDWRTATVTPIFKKGEHYLPENYRPIHKCTL